MTYEGLFVAVRHESEFLTPVFQLPMMNLTVREIIYIMSFMMSLVFGLLGSIPIELVYITFPFFLIAFVKIRGEIPEMYLYYMMMIHPSSKKEKEKKKKIRKAESTVQGFGVLAVMDEPEEVEEVLQDITFDNYNTALDITLDIGRSMAFRDLTVMIDDKKVVNDTTNGSGEITITMLPIDGSVTFKILDEEGKLVLKKAVNFKVKDN